MTATMVASAYFGDSQYGFTSLRQTAQTAIRLSPSVIKLIRDILSEEDELTCLNNPRLNRVGAKTVEKDTLSSDCRPFSSFIHSSFLESTSMLIKGSDVYCAVAQNQYDISIQTLP